jgi:plastocyanin
MPSPSPAASPQTLLDSILEVAATFIIPDWNALLSLFPIFLLILFVAWSALTLRRYATLGPRRRAPARVMPVTPAHVHMPGGSLSPILAAIGAAALFGGLVLAGMGITLGLWIGVVVMVITLLIWFREGMRDYDHLEPPQLVPAVVKSGPPPGVHMPGRSIRPLLGAIGSAALLGGLVVGGWVLILAVVFLVWTLIGWLVDFTAEYRKVEEADRTGHLENIPERRLPVRTLQVFAVAFALVAMLQLGIFPFGTTAGGGPGASPGASGPPGASLPPGTLAVVAQGVAFDTKELQVTAGQPFAIQFRNQDPPTTPHDIDLRSSDGSQVLKDQPTVPGGQEQLYQYEPLEPGTYQFICSVHPIAPMTGTLTVQ